MKLKDILNKVVNKNTKQISFNLRKRKACNVNIEKILDMEIKRDRDFLK